MDQVMVAVLDAKLKAFSQPWFVPSVGVATRAFVDAVNGDTADVKALHDHPEDFSLWEIGTWCPEEGVVKNKPHGAEQIVTALSVLRDVRVEKGVKLA